VSYGAFEPLIQESLPARLARELHQRVLDGTYPAGSQLPHQRDLAQQLNVSVSVVRESLALLASAGLVWSKSGQGTFVADAPDALVRYPTWVQVPQNADELAEALEARDILELEIVRLAAHRARPEDLRALAGIVDQMRGAADDAERFVQLDVGFHLALAQSARNRPLAAALAGLRRLMTEELTKRAHHARSEGRMAEAIEAHGALVQALAKGQGDVAVAEIRGILERGREGAERRAASPQA
jgi:GntR family transcriptional regulator, transcriptional repressor for pyruvate dehydrogenase complex